MNPSDTAADTPRTDSQPIIAGNKFAGVPIDFARELERALTAASNHPSDKVNRRYIVPLQVAYTSAMAERDRLAAQNAQLLAALKRLMAAGLADIDEATEEELKELSAAWKDAEAAVSAATKPSP